jgi:hypothetical protein
MTYNLEMVLALLLLDRSLASLAGDCECEWLSQSLNMASISCDSFVGRVVKPIESNMFNPPSDA